jgi:8-oxo-dGTP diphosphatase
MGKHKNPLLTVDTVTLCDDKFIVLVKRRNDPYKGSWALPGGFVEYGETVESAAMRETKEETGLEVELDKLVGVYSDPERDPRGHMISVCFLAHKTGGTLKAASDAAEVQHLKIGEISKIQLAFDHEEMIEKAMKIRI